MQDRFVEFTISISRLNKLIQKLKSDGMKAFDLKGAYTLCLYQLAENSYGLTSTEIALHCDLDPALVSRTLSHLCKDGIIQKVGAEGKTYHSKYFLTKKGEDIASELKEIIHRIQEVADTGISEEELNVFYSVLNKLLGNFETMSYHLSDVLPGSGSNKL